MRSVEDVQTYVDTNGVDQLRAQRARYNNGERTAVLIDTWFSQQADARADAEIVRVARDSRRAFVLGIIGAVTGIIGAVTGVIALLR